MFPAVIDTFAELTAYEYLYTTKAGSSRSAMSKALQGRRPSSAVYPEEMQDAAGERIKSILATSVKDERFAVLVDGMYQFPRSLNDDDTGLPLVYYKGNIDLASTPSVSVVGTRSIDEMGAKRAEAAARIVVERGATLVSGLADGVDTVALKTAIKCKGSVIGVIGTPITKAYPAKNKELQDYIGKHHLLISQVPIVRYAQQNVNTQRYYFPERNVTMAALSKATVIVAASSNSGTRVQARACLKQGRKLIIMENVLQSASWARGMVERGAVVIRNEDELRQELDTCLYTKE